jgi:DNA-binding NtrC family response regulator
MKNKIIVVDDEPMMVKALKRLFMSEPFDFYGFDSPTRALEHLDRIAPQVVMSDQRMPEMEGLRFLERVREKQPDTVRMILTGYYVPEKAHQAIQCGDVSAIMLKSWDNTQIIQTIRDAFHYSDSMRRPKAHSCDICNEKISSPQIRIHDSFCMCPRCRKWYEMLSGVVRESIKRSIIGNVL